MEALGRERKYSCYPFLTLALDRRKWSVSCPGPALPLGKGPPAKYPLDRRMDQDLDTGPTEYMQKCNPSTCNVHRINSNVQYKVIQHNIAVPLGHCHVGNSALKTMESKYVSVEVSTDMFKLMDK
jgi:hypothetical protein